jgi:hypothetical protein
MQRIINYLLGDKPNFVQSVERKALTDWQSNPNQVEIYYCLHWLDYYQRYYRYLTTQETIDDCRIGLLDLQAIAVKTKEQIKFLNNRLTELTNNR